MAIFDPFSTIVEPQSEIQTITNTVYLNETPKLILGIDEKLVIGIIMGILILNFLQYMMER